MKFTRFLAVASASAFTLAGTAVAQHEHHDQPKERSDRPPQHAETDADKRVGDPYALETCPISGKKLGAMGDPDVKLYEGREVRFCCPACRPKFEKDLAASMAKLDEKIVKDQAPLYPLKVSIVTGKELPAKPYEFVYGNRLVRVGAENEKAGFLKDPKKFIAELDKAVIAEQAKDYPLTSCPVSTEALGGDMGEPTDVVVAGRLIRLCCKDCTEELEQNPAKYIAMVDAARKGALKAEEPKPEKK